MRRWTGSLAWVAAAVVCLAGCGGGGDEIEATRADAGPVRYHAQMPFRDTRLLALMSFEGGLVYGFYQSDFTTIDYPEYAYAGLFIARRAQGAPAGSPMQGVEHSFEEGVARPVQLTLTINEFGLAVGAVTGGAGDPSSIAAVESDVSTLATDASTLAGDYAVQGRSVNGSLQFTARITEGRLSSTGASGCAIEAVLQPRSLGNLHDAQALLGEGCVLGAGRYTGHAFQAYNTGNVYMLLESPAGAALMLLLSRPT